MSTLNTLAAAAVLALPLVSAETWGWTSSENVCAGIITDCTDQTSCTTTGVGPCTGKDTVAPTAYLKSSLVGLAFVDDDKYLACKDPTDCADMKIIMASGVGYVDHDAAVVLDADTDKKYAYVMTGNVYGDITKTGAYAGVASYLNTGAVDITTNSNNVYGVVDPKAIARKARGTSTKGAPAGPYTVCITDAAGGKCTGDLRTFKPSEYKFSIFGALQGAEYDATVVAGKNGFPAGLDHLGFRMKLSTVGFKVEDIKINGAAYDAANQNVNVKSLDLDFLHVDFPQKYNIGAFAGGKTDGTMLPVSATKTIKIKVHSADKVKQFMYIDYLFETATLKNGQYFMYDPSISSTDPAATADKSAASTVAVNMVAMLGLFGLSMFL